MNGTQTHKCGFCGLEFTEDEAQSTCSSCPISSCQKVCCPNCGYEYLPEPNLIKAVRNWRARRKKG